MGFKTKVTINITTLIMMAGIIFGILYSNNLSSSVQSLDIRVQQQKEQTDQSIASIHSKLDKLLQMEIDELNRAKK